MRFLRFSNRQLLLFTGLVAVLLYVLFIRPVTVAKSFVYKLEHTAPTEITKYLGDVDIGTDGVHVECVLNERSWADIFRCRQTFVVSVVGADPESSTRETVEDHFCSSTLFGVTQEEPYESVRDKKQ
jgi:hypothetical protein